MKKELNVGNDVYKYRYWKGLTQKELAKQLGISLTHLQNIEHQKVLPKYHVRAKICKLFNVYPNQIFYIKGI